MFLTAITLYTISSMRSSNIGLHMAQNEESRVAAVQAAQALADAVVANPASTPVVGTSGFTACTPGQPKCDRSNLPVENPVLATAVASSHMSARVQRTGLTFQPPPRAVESSIDKFTSASFRVTTTFDRSEDGLGRQQVTEGVLVLVPKN
jgi:hypothetical protein